MKYIFFLISLLPLSLLAQDCNLKKGTDIITSRPNLTTGFIELGGNTLSIDVSSKEIDFFFVLNNSAMKCLNEETELTVNFEGGKLKTDYRNNGSMNCDGIFHVIFKNSAYTNSNLQKMAAKKILSFSWTGSNPKPFVISLSAEQQDMLQKTITCVIAGAKTVL